MLQIGCADNDEEQRMSQRRADAVICELHRRSSGHLIDAHPVATVRTACYIIK